MDRAGISESKLKDVWARGWGMLTVDECAHRLRALRRLSQRVTSNIEPEKASAANAIMASARV
jgi:hypothetical protein